MKRITRKNEKKFKMKKIFQKEKCEENRKNQLKQESGGFQKTWVMKCQITIFFYYFEILKI